MRPAAVATAVASHGRRKVARLLGVGLLLPLEGGRGGGRASGSACPFAQAQVATAPAPSKNLFLQDEPDVATGAASATVSGRAFFDADDNGRYDIAGGDYGIHDLAVHLVRCDGVPADTSKTDSLGRYAFDGVARRDGDGAPARYYIAIMEHPAYYAPSEVWNCNGLFPEADNVIDPAAKRSACFEVGAAGATASIGMAFSSAPATAEPILPPMTRSSCPQTVEPSVSLTIPASGCLAALAPWMVCR